VKDLVVLTVEDSDAFAHAMELAIEEAGLAVRLFRVQDGEEAMHFLRHEAGFHTSPTPDLIFLDLNLPRMTGFDVLAEMKHDVNLEGIPTVVLTSSSAPSDRARSMALGANDYILKPTDFDRLLSTVTKTCQRYTH